MFSCVYTTQKTKKLKKWMDGFVVKKGQGLVLYSEEEKAIHKCTTFTVLEDSSIEASMYLIWIENMGEFMEGTQNKESSIMDNARECGPEPSLKVPSKLNEGGKSIDGHNNSLAGDDCAVPGQGKRPCVDGEKSTGRSVEDILSLLQKQ